MNSLLSILYLGTMIDDMDTPLFVVVVGMETSVQMFSSFSSRAEQGPECRPSTQKIV